jgi:hypothetical protein
VANDILGSKPLQEPLIATGLIGPNEADHEAILGAGAKAVAYAAEGAKI